MLVSLARTRIIAIDPGTTNFAYVVLEGEHLLREQRLRLCPSEARGPEIANSVAHLLGGLIKQWEPAQVWIESQMRDKMIMVSQSCLSTSMENGVRANLIHPMKWKSLMGVRATGSHHLNKKVAVERVRILGYPITDHNIADALLIGLAVQYGRRQTTPPEWY